MAKKKSLAKKYQRQYRELLYNAHQIYNDLTLALKLGEDTPKFERVLREAGTRTGLTKPTAKSIKALKKLQTKSGILRQVMWATKGEAHEKAKELFDEQYDREKESKKRERNEKKLKRDIEQIKEDIIHGDWTQDELQELQETLDKKVEDLENLVKNEDLAPLEELKRQAQIIVDKLNSEKYLSQVEIGFRMKAQSIIDIINMIIGSGDAATIREGSMAAERISRQYGTLGIEELYNSGDKINNELLDALYGDESFGSDLPEGWAS